MQRIWFTPMPNAYLILIYCREDGVVTKKIKSLISFAVAHSANISHVIILIAPWQVFNSADGIVRDIVRQWPLKRIRVCYLRQNN